MNKYDELGIGNRDTMVHSIFYTNNTDKYQFLIDFALNVLDPCNATNTQAAATSSIEVFPNPFDDNISISGLSGDEYFILRNVSGQVMTEGNSFDVLNLPDLNAGFYFLMIQSETTQKVVKLIKH